MTETSPIVYLNGDYLPLEDARISVMDRGFLFGDGVYEMIPVYGNRIFRLKEHLDRLQNSLDAIDITNPYSIEEWGGLIETLLRKNPVSNHRSIYIEVTRGVGDRDHIYEERLNPTVFILCRPVTPKDFSSGVYAITHPDIRWEYCHIKSVSLLPAVILKNLASHTDGAREAILIKDGVVTEGASSNVFIVKDGIAITPPKSNSLLPGITRDLIIELMDENGFDHRETEITEGELRNADEVWITSSVMEIAPVVRLDRKPVGGSVPGEAWHRVKAMYESFKQSVIESDRPGNQ